MAHAPIVHRSRKAPQEEEDAAKLKFGEGLFRSKFLYTLKFFIVFNYLFLII
jgi:hypothetical protein